MEEPNDAAAELKTTNAAEELEKLKEAIHTMGNLVNSVNGSNSQWD